jgi:hypothetical protein
MRRNASRWEMAICLEEPISEIPDEWYDEDTGELKSEYQDGTGCLQLPVVRTPAIKGATRRTASPD